MTDAAETRIAISLIRDDWLVVHSDLRAQRKQQADPAEVRRREDILAKIEAAMEKGDTDG